MLCEAQIPPTPPSRLSPGRITALRPLPSPAALRAAIAGSAALAQSVAGARTAIRAILSGRDDRLLVVVGPCSIHDPAAALDYAARLAGERQALSDRLEIVMRVYFEKPRTTTGWKGLIADPRLDGGDRIEEGLALARRLLRDITAMGLPAATEFLDPLLADYVEDLIAWGAIGARTTESQIHRQMASGLACPVGFKNGTDGNVQIALDAIRAAAAPHSFVGMDPDGRAAIATTTGNADCHVVLRGGSAGPNYAPAQIDAVAAAAARAGVDPGLVIDASHANSGKDPARQPAVIADIAAQIRAGETRIRGVMLESNLVAGRQDVVAGRPLTYGQSITDGCIGWDDTRRLLHALAETIEARPRQAA